MILLYKITGDKLNELRELPFEKEKTLQNLIEKNLKSIFDLDLIASEFTIKNVRFDILAFNTKSNSFVIIELKNKTNFSVIDQGYAYLGKLKENKYEVSEVAKETGLLQNKKPDWEQTKVIFISPEYTKFQVMLSESNNLPIELWEVKRYEDNVLQFKKIENLTSSPTQSLIPKNSEISKEIKVYTENDHLKDLEENDVKEAYLDLKDALLANGMTINVQKYYISFRKSKNIAYIRNFTKKHFEIVVMLPYDIGKQSIKNHKIKSLSPGIQHFYGAPCFAITIDKNNDLDEIINIIKEAADRL
jgi:predicted transport protein